MSELDKLEQYLKENNIEYTREDKERGVLVNTHQIVVFDKGNRIWDAICHYGSYGYEKGLLEVMGEPVVKPEDGDSVCGYLTAQDVIERWEEYKNNGGMWI